LYIAEKTTRLGKQKENNNTQDYINPTNSNKLNKGKLNMSHS